MSKELVKQTLEELAESRVPANPDLWPGIQVRLTAVEDNNAPQSGSLESKTGLRKEKPRLSWPRLVVAGMSLAVLFVVVVLLVALINANNNMAQPQVGQKGGSPVPTSSTRDDLDTIEKECTDQKLGDFDCLMKIDQGGQVQVFWLPLSKDLNLTQTNNGFTVSVRRVYADAGTIFIGYDIKGPEGIRTDLGKLELKDGQGNVIAAGGHAFEGLGYNSAQFASFDGTVIKDNPQNFKVHLTVSGVTIRGNPPTATTEPNLTQTPNNLQTSGSVVANTAGPNTFVNVPTSFAFDFEIPFQGGKVVEINQTVKAGDRELTLERAIVAPSGTSFLLSGFSKDRRNIAATITTPNGGGGYHGSNEISMTAEELNWRDDMTNQFGEWTLTVTELGEEGVTCKWEGGYQCTQPSPGAPQPKEITLGGPWTFHFTIK